LRDVPLPIDFLLGSPAPWVRYQTRSTLLGERATKDRQAVLADPVVRRLVKEAQGWPGNSRGEHRAAKDLLNKLSLLSDFGLRATDPGVGRFVEAVHSHTGEDGRLLGHVLFPRQAKPEWMFDVDGQDTLLALVGLGCAADVRVKRATAAVLALESNSGGWVWPEARSPLPCRRFDGGCPYPTVKILRILAHVRGPQASAAAQRGTELLLSLWERRDDERRYGFGMAEHFLALRYPFIWFDALHVLEALSPFPWTWRDKRFHSLLDNVLDKADGNGRFTPESVYLEWKAQCFGQKREPSPWLTFVVHRILARRRTVGGDR
jgi:hypothetical protein